MGKTRAEIQRAYRKRKLEKEGETYLEKERLRQQKYYVPISERSKKDAKERREKVLKWVRKHRKERSVTKSNVREDKRNETISDENEVSSTVPDGGCSSETLQVKMPFSSPGYARVRKRISRATSKQRREIEKLKRDNLNLTRKYKTECKRRLRLQMKQQKTRHETDKTVENLTPRRRTQRDLIDNGISPSEVPQAVVKKLLLSNVIVAEVQSARNIAGTKGKKLINQILAGGITKKYRMRRALSKSVGMNRRTLNTNTKACSVAFRRRNQLIHEQTKASVIDFMTRDDNSREMPGKADAKKVEGQQQQRRILNDSLHNLFLKFQAEMSTVKMSLSTFCKLRPKNVTLTKYLSKNKCLCQRHQNMALLLKCLKAQGAAVPLNPEDYARRIDNEGPAKFLSEIKSNNISYEKWQRVSCSDGKKRMKIVQHEISKQEFSEMFHKETAEFLEHTSRIREQYRALCDLKENLPNGHVIIQMDFAENFTCSSAEEVQSAYWNASLVTLHPVVLYFKSAVQGSLLHKSYVFVSDDGGHNAGSVNAFMKKLVPTIQEDIGSVSWIHYWTDSPSSQYRNKSIFYIVSDHKNLLGVQASWNYFEAGHGKGPCDGIGGTSKRMADLSVRQGKAVIQDAEDYYLWGTRFNKSSKYLFIKSAAIASVRSELEDLVKGVIPLKGTMKLHAIAPVAPGKIVSRTTSCYCSQCLSARYHSDWAPGDILKKIPNLDTPASQQLTDQVDDVIQVAAAETPEYVSSSTHTADSSSVPVTPEDGPSSTHTADSISVPVTPEVGKYVAAVYDKQWYVGVVKEIDDDEAECSISFMEKSKTQFKWPSRKDEVWIAFSDLLCILKPPVAVGRSRRTFSFEEKDMDLVNFVIYVIDSCHYIRVAITGLQFKYGIITDQES